MENSYTKWKERQEDLRDDIKQDAIRRLEKYTDNVFKALHKKYNTSSGDISPNQQFELELLIRKTSDLIAEQVYQNIKL